MLDATTLIPEETLPARIVGRMVLNRTPDTFVAETDQVAFLPTNVPPGIDFSDDPLLQGRTFSYLDTQLSRLGSANWPQIPINLPKSCSLADAGEPDGPLADAATGFRRAAAAVDGVKSRRRAESFADPYSQARLFFRSQSAVEQGHMVSAQVFELSKVTLAQVRARVLANLQNVDKGLAERRTSPSRPRCGSSTSIPARCMGGVSAFWCPTTATAARCVLCARRVRRRAPP